MKQRPILFSGPMVRAILEGRKTQTRRVVKHDAGKGWGDVRDSDGWPMDQVERAVWKRAACPYGVPGDRLWVKETWCRGRVFTIYRVDNPPYDPPSGCTDEWNAPVVDRWRPSIHMPRGESRLTLEVVAVRVERLQEITDEDARAEGYADRAAFLNGDWAKAQEGNPWVWVVEFKRIGGGA